MPSKKKPAGAGTMRDRRFHGRRRPLRSREGDDSISARVHLRRRVCEVSGTGRDGRRSDRPDRRGTYGASPYRGVGGREDPQRSGGSGNARSVRTVELKQILARRACPARASRGCGRLPETSIETGPLPAGRPRAEPRQRRRSSGIDPVRRPRAQAPGIARLWPAAPCGAAGGPSLRCRRAPRHTLVRSWTTASNSPCLDPKWL